MRTRVHLTIHGRVQGVSFRYYARRQAQALGLSGWVRNCPGGSVEAVAEGEQDAVQRFIVWTQRGSPSADVEHVDVERQPPINDDEEFRIVG